MGRIHSQLYRQFAAIEPTDYQRLIRTYEEMERELGRLDPGEYFELTVRYVDALFATGAYRRFLLVVDVVIEATFEQHMPPDTARELLKRCLFRKSAAAYQIQNYDWSQYLAEELVRMHPDDPLHRRLLRAVRFKQQHRVLQFGRATFIFCLLAAAFVIVLDMMVVQPFYASEHHLMVILRNDLLILSILALVGCFGYAWWSSNRYAQRYGRT